MVIHFNCLFVVVDIWYSHQLTCCRSKSKSLIGLHAYLLWCCKFIFYLQLGGCKYKIYNMMTVNFVICSRPVYAKITTRQVTFNCISIVVDWLFFVYLYMARKGIEVIQYYRYVVLYFKLDRLHIQRVLYNKCSCNNLCNFRIHWKEK